MDCEIIEQKVHPLGGFLLARLPDGRYLAGKTLADSVTLADAQEVYDVFRKFADDGKHWAWNICYAVS